MIFLDALRRVVRPPAPSDSETEHLREECEHAIGLIGRRGEAVVQLLDVVHADLGTTLRRPRRGQDKSIDIGAIGLRTARSLLFSAWSREIALAKRGQIGCAAPVGGTLRGRIRAAQGVCEEAASAVACLQNGRAMDHRGQIVIRQERPLARLRYWTT